jgi:hypothetical protein
MNRNMKGIGIDVNVNYWRISWVAAVYKIFIRNEV